MPKEYRLFDPAESDEWIGFARKSDAKAAAERSAEGELDVPLKGLEWKRRAPDTIRLVDAKGGVHASIITVDLDAGKPMFYQVYTGGDPEWEGKYFHSLTKAMRMMEKRWSKKNLFWEIKRGRLSLREEGSTERECYGEIHSFRGERPENILAF